jgi:hypothetical protein
MIPTWKLQLELQQSNVDKRHPSVKVQSQFTVYHPFPSTLLISSSLIDYRLSTHTYLLVPIRQLPILWRFRNEEPHNLNIGGTRRASERN